MPSVFLGALRRSQSIILAAAFAKAAVARHFCREEERFAHGGRVGDRGKVAHDAESAVG